MNHNRSTALKFGEKYIKCHFESESVNKVFKICLDESVTVLPGMEMIVKGKISDENGCLSHASKLVIKSKLDSVLAKQGIFVAKEMVLYPFV